MVSYFYFREVGRLVATSLLESLSLNNCCIFYGRTIFVVVESKNRFDAISGLNVKFPIATGSIKNVSSYVIWWQTLETVSPYTMPHKQRPLYMSNGKH